MFIGYIFKFQRSSLSHQEWEMQDHRVLDTSVPWDTKSKRHLQVCRFCLNFVNSQGGLSILHLVKKQVNPMNMVQVSLVLNSNINLKSNLTY